MTRYKSGLPTMSLGHGAAGYSMRDKIAAIADIGFNGVEILYGCLEAFAEELYGDKSRQALKNAAVETAKLCKQNNLEVICLQPVLNYEGIRDPTEHAKRLDDMLFRMDLAKILGTDLLQLAASFLPESERSHDFADIVRDLQEISDHGLQRQPPIRFAYESMCWSTPVISWRTSWEIVQAVDRPNFGLVLDTFHIAGYDYADPSVPSFTRSDAQSRMAATLDGIKQIPAEKIFFLQTCDAEKLDQPITEGESLYYNPEQPARMSWSRNCRLFPYEEDRGGFMPVEEVTKAILATGFEGFISFELFTRFISQSGIEGLPRLHAQRAKASWDKLSQRLKF